MTVNLGLPEVPAAPLATRRVSRQIMVGKGAHAVAVGGGAPVSVAGSSAEGVEVVTGHAGSGMTIAGATSLSTGTISTGGGEGRDAISSSLRRVLDS